MIPSLTTLLQAPDRYPRILAECAIAERLRRVPGIELHPTLFNTPFIYGPGSAREAMTALYREYILTAAVANLPLLLTAPTWRLDAERVAAAGVPQRINTDAVNYLRAVRDRFAREPSLPVLVGALVGPRRDCYQPERAPGADEAADFHAAQIDKLAVTEADFLLAQTLPAVGEAIGIARRMAATDKPYLISFCAGVDGRVLDGTPLVEAVAAVRGDASVASRPPVGFMVNCTHPRFVMEVNRGDNCNQNRGDDFPILGIQANGSSKDVTALEGSGATEADSVEDWAAAMFASHQRHGVRVLGGCCGTGLEHMEALARLPMGAPTDEPDQGTQPG